MSRAFAGSTAVPAAACMRCVRTPIQEAAHKHTCVESLASIEAAPLLSIRTRWACALVRSCRGSRQALGNGTHSHVHTPTHTCRHAARTHAATHPNTHSHGHLQCRTCVRTRKYTRTRSCARTRSCTCKCSHAHAHTSRTPNQARAARQVHLEMINKYTIKDNAPGICGNLGREFSSKDLIP